MPKLDAFPSINNASLSRIGERLATSIASICLIGSAALLSGCAGDANDETAGWSQNKLYVEAKDAMDGGDNAKCVKYFEKLEARYPFGPYAQQSQINVAYCHWKDGELAQAITAVDRFLQLHPGHPSVDYAYYLKGLITFNDNMGFMGKLTGQDLSERDPRAARDAFEAFKTLTTRFPESKYTPDALDRMRYIVNSLADSDVNTARYYYRRGAYLAAINRAQRAITDYDQHCHNITARQARYLEIITAGVFINDTAWCYSGFVNYQFVDRPVFVVGIIIHCTIMRSEAFV
jgi:outer membrane protein assembly factor BamD